MQDFEHFSAWVEREFGLRLSAYKERQMQRRLDNLIIKAGATDYLTYMQLLQNSPQAREQFLQYVTINVTDFYRNPEIFTIFEKHLQTFSKQQTLKIWSAACSIGSEPYTLAMLLAKHEFNQAQIVATDLDQAVLNQAIIGRYNVHEMRNVPTNDIQQFFEMQPDQKYQVTPSLKRYITFKQHDLLTNEYEKDCQIIVCRNVTIYFKAEARDEVYQKFSDALVPGGILFTGATETINFPEQFNLQKIDSFIYQKVN